MSKNFKYMLVAIILLTPVLANNFLTGTVSNYGDGTTSVGELWTGRADWFNYVKQATLTVNRAVNKTYIDYPIELRTIFPYQSQAPLWPGYFVSGTYREYTQRTIKVIQQDNTGIWHEIPSQISFKTKCFDSILGTPGVDCSTTNDRISSLYLYMLSNLTSSTEYVNVLYSFNFGGTYTPIPTNFYRFEYDELEGAYLQYNNTNSIYPPRIQYVHSDEDITTDLDVTYLRANGDISEMKVGGCTSSGWSGISIDYANGLLDCDAGTITNTKIFGATPNQDLNVSVVLEIYKEECNLVGLGAATGQMYEDIYPNIIIQRVIPETDNVNPQVLYDVSATASSGAGCLGNDFTINQYAQYLNTSSTLVNWQNGALEGGINPAYAGTGAVHSAVCNNGVLEYAAVGFAPVVYTMKETKSSYARFGGQQGRTYTASASSSVIASNSKMNITQVLTSDVFEVYTVAVDDNIADSWVGGTFSCTVDDGTYTSYEDVIDILEAEPDGGRIISGVTFSQFDFVCLPTSTTGSCLSEYVYEWEGMECLDSGNIGYTDNCGNEYPCLQCSACTDNGDSFTCDGTCVPRYASSVICVDGDLQISTTCDTYTQECNYGCLSGKCLTENLGILYTWVYDSINNTVVGGANVSVYSPATGYLENITTDFNGKSAFTIPTGYNYEVYADKDGYIPGCVNPTPIGTSFNTYCSLNMPVSYSANMKFNIFPTGTTENYTRSKIIVKHGYDFVEDANVSIYHNDVYDTGSLTDANGEALFTWPDFTYNNTEVVITKSGFQTATKIIALIPLKQNEYIIYLKADSDIKLFGGLTGADANTVYAQLFWLGDLPIPIYSEKPGKLKLTRVDYTVKGCDDFMCDTKKLYWANCLQCRNCTRDAIQVKRAISEQGNYDFTVGDIIEDGIVSSTTLRDWVSNDRCQMETQDNSTFLRRFGANYMSVVCLAQVGTDWVLHRLELIPGTMTIPRAIAANSFEPFKSIIEVLTPKNQDIFIEDIIFQCNNDEISTAIFENKRYRVQYGDYLKEGNYVEIISDPALRQIVRTGQSPFILPNGEILYDYVENYQSNLPPYDIQDRTLDLGEFYIMEGTNGLGDSKRYTNALTRNKLFGDILLDLKTGEFISSEARYAATDSELVPFERAKIDTFTKFEIVAYLKADFYPEDGSGKQTTFYRVIIHDQNIDPTEFLFNYWVFILALIVFVLPGIAIFYLVFLSGIKPPKKREGLLFTKEDKLRGF